MGNFVTPIERIDYFNLTHMPGDYIPVAHALRKDKYVPIEVPIGVVDEEIESLGCLDETPLVEYIEQLADIAKQYPHATIETSSHSIGDDEVYTYQIMNHRPQTEDEAVASITDKSRRDLSVREAELRTLRELKAKYGE